MDFSFIVPTNASHHSDDQKTRLNLIIDSIEKENIPQYEILLIGQADVDRRNTQIIEFDENTRPNLITRKKNLGSELANFEIIIYMHDYITLYPGWYNGYKKFGNDFDICMNVIINTNNERFRDWIAFDDFDNPGQRLFWHKNFPQDKPFPICPYLPEYSYKKTNKMYISGSYWVAKKSVSLKYPQNEEMTWNTPEDIWWSMIVRDCCNIRMNTFSAVKLLHKKDSVWTSWNPYHMTNEYITKDLA